MLTRREFFAAGIKAGVALGVVGYAGNVLAGSMPGSNNWKNMIVGPSRTRAAGLKNEYSSTSSEPKLPPLPHILDSLIAKPIGTKIPGIPPGIKLAGKVYEQAWVVRDEPEKLIEFIKKFDYKNEPASYLIAGYLFENPWEIATSKESWAGNLSTNDPMVHFAHEIGEYLSKYLRRQKIAPSRIEDPAHDSIQISSQLSIQELLNGKLNISSIGQRDLKILIWATTWLIDHLNPNAEYKQYYSKVEMIIRKKHPGLKIRGDYHT